VQEADVVAGHHVKLLKLLVAMENRVVRLARGEYELLKGDVSNAEHNSNTSLYPPVWRAGYGPPQIAAGVSIVGQEGVVLSGWHARLKVSTKGVSFDSMEGGSLTMTRCTSAGEISTDANTSLVMEDSRVSGSNGNGVHCHGKLKATRCTFEDNRYCGTCFRGSGGLAQLVDCVMRKNTTLGVYGTEKG